jgi:exosortase/archaeosortase
MNPKLVAVRKTAGQLALFLFTVFAIVFVSQFVSLQFFVWAITLAFVAMVAFMLYHINLDDAVLRSKNTEKSSS